MGASLWFITILYVQYKPSYNSQMVGLYYNSVTTFVYKPSKKMVGCSFTAEFPTKNPLVICYIAIEAMAQSK